MSNFYFDIYFQEPLAGIMNSQGLQRWHYIFFGVAIFFIIIAILAYTNNPLLFWGWEGELYWRFYTYISAGQRPFIDFFIEYPPISSYFIALPALFSRSLNHFEYLTFFVSIASFLALLGPFIVSWTFAVKSKLAAIYFKNEELVSSDLTATLEKTKHSHSLETIQSINRWNSIYLILLIPSFTLITTRYDIFPAFFSFLGVCLYLISLDSSKKIWVWLAYLSLSLATFIKIYPVLIIFLFLVLDLWRIKMNNILIGIISFIVFLTPTIYFSVAGNEKFQGFLNYQTASRDLQIESVWASASFGLEKLGLVEPSKIVLQSGAFEISNQYAKNLGKINLYIIALIFIISSIILIINLKPWKEKFNLDVTRYRLPSKFEITQLAIIGSLFVISTFLLWNKVLSPQYLIWIVIMLPLLGLINLTKKQSLQIGIAWLTILILTFILYPLSYDELIKQNTLHVIILLFRNSLLFLWWIWLFKKLTQVNTYQ